MIKSIDITNYALLKKVVINFNNGFTCISGETGSGKSIILDALSLLLGKRVERLSIAKNKRKSIIEGVFRLKDIHKTFFKDNDLDFEYNTVVRREIITEGKSRAFINDTPVLLQTLSLFGKQIIEIYAQDQAMLLKDENSKFNLLDQLSKTDEYLKKYREDYRMFNQLKKDLQVIKDQGSLSATEIDFLKFQYQELESVGLSIGEKEDLERKVSLLDNIDSISTTLNESASLLNNEHGILDFLTIIKTKLSKFDNLSELSRRLESIIVELDDINIEFSSIINNLVNDPKELINMHNRLDLINGLLHKHRLSFVEQLIDLKDDFHSRLELSASFDVFLSEKQELIDKKQNELIRSVGILNKNRLKILPNLKLEIENLLKKLGMPYAKFDIEINENEQFHLNGNTSISFRFSANKGEDMKELRKVASGGELSRLMLAIKYITSKSSKVNTLIFDEIDSGVSGEVASLMGDMMSDISTSSQLISISHLPQIASKAETHLKVKKIVLMNETVSTVVELDKDGRIEEIAKLLSGKKITQAAIDNAVDLLNQ